MQLSYFIALRLLWRNQSSFSSFFLRMAMLATALSVMVMILSVGFVNGFKKNIEKKLFNFMGHYQIVNYQANPSALLVTDPLQYDANLLKHLKEDKEIKDVQLFALRNAILKSKSLMEGVLLKGVDSTFRIHQLSSIKGEVTFRGATYSANILISDALCNRLDLKIGDSLFAYFIEQGALTPRIRKLAISGTYHTGIEEIDRQLVLCDVRLVQRLNEWQANEYSGYQIWINDPKKMNTLANKTKMEWVYPPLSVETMVSVFPNIFDWLHVQDMNVLIIIIIMSIVSMVNIITMMLLFIIERSKMTGLLKAMGMKPLALMKIFIFHALMIAAVGILIGNVLGVGLCYLQDKFHFIKLEERTYYLSYAPVDLSPLQVLVIDFGTLIICGIILILPAILVKRNSVIEALRIH